MTDLLIILLHLQVQMDRHRYYFSYIIKINYYVRRLTIMFKSSISLKKIKRNISSVQETLRTALAMGADRAIHVEVPAKVCFFFQLAVAVFHFFAKYMFVYETFLGDTF